MDTSKILADLRAERELVNQSISALEALSGTPAAKSATKTAAHVGVNGAEPAPVVSTAAKKRVISPEGRLRMAEAQQKRWAKKKRAVKAAAKNAAKVAPAAPKSAKAAPVASSSVKRVGKPMSAATKKKLAVAAKARWAAKKAATTVA